MTNRARHRGLASLALLAIAALAIVASAQRSWRVPTVTTGLTLGAAVDGAVLVAGVAPGGPAEQAGLRAADRLLEVGGRPVASRVAAEDALARSRGGAALPLVVLRDGTAHGLQLQPLAETHFRPDRITATIVALLFWVAAALTVARPRPGAPAGVFLAWSIAGALVLGVSWTGSGERLDWVLFWIDRAARLLLPALWIHLALALRRGGAGRRWLPAAYAPAAGLLLAEIWVAGLGGALRASDPVGAVEWLRGRVELGWIVVGLSLGLGLFVHAARRAGGEARARARWFVAGTCAGLFPYLAFAALPHIVGGSGPAYGWLSLPFLGLLPLMFTSAVLDYRLMDLALFTRRAISATATLLFSAILFVGLLSLARVVVPVVLKPPGIVPVLVAAVVTGLMAPAIRAGARDLVGRLFYRRRYDFRRALARVARDLNAERELPRLQEILERRIGEALDAGVVRLLLVGEGGTLLRPATREPAGDVLSSELRATLGEGSLVSLALRAAAAATHLPRLNAAGVQVLVPLRVEGQLIAVLAVGPARESAPLDSDDLDLLRSVAGHAAAAVAGALHLAELRAQVQLVERLQARTEALIDSSPVGLAVIDPDGVVRHWNAALEQVLGVPRERALARPFGDVLPASLRSVVREFLRQSPLPERSRAYRIRIPAPGDGVPGHAGGRLVDIAAAPLRGVDGPESLLLTIDDVTERMRLEEQLIQQDRLASVGLLAAGVAHEINTPLTGISSFAQMMLSDCAPDDPRHPLLQTIVQQAGRAAQIARGLLRFSRPGPVLETSLGPVDVRDLLQETVGLLGPQIRKAQASVECAFNGGPVLALADRPRLQQVLINLLLNALDAVPAGGQVVARAHAEGESVRLAVEDNGCGIPEHLRGRIFDPFFTTKKPGQGTGLGLSISYSIVREHGGSLSAESEPGRGTVMHVTLPAFPASLRGVVPTAPAVAEVADSGVRRAV